MNICLDFQHRARHIAGALSANAERVALRFLVVSMQLGFAMLEVGGVREAHRMTVLAKSLGLAVRKKKHGKSKRNLMDSVVTCLAFQLSVQFMNLTLVQDANGSESQLATWY